MKVAVTGASRHIGNYLVRERKKQGATVKVLVHDFKNDLDKLACPFLNFYYSVTNGKSIYTFQSLNFLINSPKNISFEANKELGYAPLPLEQILRYTFN